MIRSQKKNQKKLFKSKTNSPFDRETKKRLFATLLYLDRFRFVSSR